MSTGCNLTGVLAPERGGREDQAVETRAGCPKLGPGDGDGAGDRGLMVGSPLPRGSVPDLGCSVCVIEVLGTDHGEAAAVGAEGDGVDAVDARRSRRIGRR